MRHGRHVILLSLAIASLLLLAPEAVLGQRSGAPAPLQRLEAMISQRSAAPAPLQRMDLASLLSERQPETVIGALKEGMQERVRDRWSEILMKDSQVAAERNQSQLYPNPSLQAYVNRLGQSLIPREVSEKVLVTFKIVEDPLPYADSLATGTIYLSSGIISLLDNESQLAFLLMHEAGHFLFSHHVQQAIEEEKVEKRADQIKLVGGAAGALLTGGILDGGNLSTMILGSYGGYYGYKAGNLFGPRIASAFSGHRFRREIQLESDLFATEIVLRHGFDAREAPVLMAKVGDIVQRSNAAVELAFGNARDLPHRSARINELLGGPYSPDVARVLEGDGFRMSSPRYSQLMAELKRDNGLLALDRDLFAIARANLEEAAAVRTDDPLTMYGLGMLYRTVGRTKEDAARASGYLKSAMEFDEIRHRFPEAHLQYAVELLSREDPQLHPEIQKALKDYVVLHQRKLGGGLPREMPFVYDYLDLTGDHNWIAYNVNNVSCEAPYQLTGDPQVDKSVARANAKKAPK